MYIICIYRERLHTLSLGGRFYMGACRVEKIKLHILICFNICAVHWQPDPFYYIHVLQKNA